MNKKPLTKPQKWLKTPITLSFTKPFIPRKMVSHRQTFLLLISLHSASGIGYWL